MVRLISSALAVTFVLFAAVAAEAGKGAKPQRTPEQRFSKADKNGDQKLSLDEFIGKKTAEKKERATKQFSKLDKNGDSFVTLDEFKSRRKKNG